MEAARDPRRVVAMAVVALLHAAAVYAMAQWRTDERAPAVSRPLQVALIGEEQVIPLEAPPPAPQRVEPAIFIEQPLLELPQFAQAPHSKTPASSSVSQVQVTFTPVASASPASVKLVATVEYLKPLQPRYPSTSRRLREEGLVVLLVLVDESGKASRIEVRDSSGYPRLDRAAEEAVAYAKFKPYVEGGTPRSAFVLIPVEFSLNQRFAQR